MNKCVLLGRITADIELRRTQSGIETCVFTIAINNGKDKNGNEREADFITCRAWRETASFITKWFSKGKMILVEGKFKTDKYPHKNHPDVTMYSSYVLVDNVEFAGEKNSTNGGQKAVQAAQAAGVPTSNGFEELPSDEFEGVISDGTVPF